MAAWRSENIRPIVDRQIDQVIERGRSDLVDEVAEGIPIRADAAVRGLPWEDVDWIRECKRHMDTVATFFDHRLKLNQPVIDNAIAAAAVLNR